MSEDDVDSRQEQEETVEENNSQEQNKTQAVLWDQDLLLLVLILVLFFSKRDIFSEQLQFLNQKANNIKNYLDAADATLQALDQASQMPNQILK
ncbi:MAG: hypothetical protein ACQERJ_05060 [Bacillota bacterium]